MTDNLVAIPLWAAVIASIFLLLGAALSLFGAIGLARLGRFYDRLHAPTLITSWGTGGMVMGSMIIFAAAGSRVPFHEILLGIFVVITTPITLMMLGRASVYRDRAEGNPDVPHAAEEAE